MLNKKAEGSLSGGSPAGTIILVVFLGFILLYLIMIPQEYRDEYNLTPTPEYSSVVFEEYPSRLHIQDEDDLPTETKTYSMSKVVLDNTPQADSKLLLPQGLLKKSIISADVLRFNFNIDNLNNLNKLYINANIIEKRGSGDLIVKLNGVTIYSSEARLNDNLKIPLPLHQLEEFNTVKITTSSPGLLFWTVNSYLLSDIYLIEEEYTRVNSDSNRIVNIDNKYLTNVQDIKFSAYVNKLSSSAEKLKISINGNTLYDEVPSDDSPIEREIPKEYVKSGVNQIQFEVERDGKYELKYMDLSLKKVDLSNERIAKYKFSLNEKQFKKVSDPDYECELFTSKSGGDKSINVELNDNLLRYSFDDNYEIHKDVCEYLVEGENEIIITPDREVYFNIIRIKVKSK